MRRLCILLIASSLLIASLASAGPKIALLAADRNSSTFHRLNGELQATGFDVLPLAALDAEQSWKRSGAKAAVALDAARSSAKILFVERRPALIVGVDHAQSNQQADRELALRTAEVLRATLDVRGLAVAARAAPAPAAERPAPLPVAKKATAVSSPPRFVFEALYGVSLGPDRFSASEQLWLSVGWSPRRWFHLELTALLPTASEGFHDGDSQGGTVHVRFKPTLLAAGARFSSGDHRSRVRASAGVGLGAQLAFAEYLAYDSGFSTTYSGDCACATPAAYARTGVSLRLFSTVRLRLDAMVGAAFQELAITLPTYGMRWGQIFFNAGFGLELRL